MDKYIGFDIDSQENSSGCSTKRLKRLRRDAAKVASHLKDKLVLRAIISADKPSRGKIFLTTSLFRQKMRVST